jgi:superfamily II DNA/RNA helicase
MSRAYESYVESLQESPSPLMMDATSEVQLPTALERTLEAQGRKEDQEEGEDRLHGPLSDFAVLGIRKSVRVALHEAFPNIQTPTACQTAFIPAVLSNKDVILKDWTGTGK